MKLATRINSLLPGVDGDVLKALEIVSDINGITSVDLNYPEHFQGIPIEELKAKLKELNLEVNGVALRFRNEFINGDLGNLDDGLAESAYKLCENAMDACEVLGGEVITIWLGHDGFDYPFQLNYAKVWNRVKESIQKIAAYNKKLKISIEYKPYEERSYALIDSIGSTMLMVNDIGADNVGVTVDYCHMLMKKENPAFSLSLAAEKDKLFGVHINDGYGYQDDGLMLGTSSFFQTIEFLYYMKKYANDITVYFDTFPLREDPVGEIKQNVAMFHLMVEKIDAFGLEAIQEYIDKNDAVESHKLMMKFLQSN